MKIISQVFIIYVCIQMNSPKEDLNEMAKDTLQVKMKTITYPQLQ